MSIRKGTTPVDYEGGIKTTEEKGGENKKLTKDEIELRNFMVKNKGAYRGAPIRDLEVWGIGLKAITLGHIMSNDGYGKASETNTWCNNKEFHNYTKKINKENSFDDGISVLEELIDKYGRLDASKGERWSIEDESVKIIRKYNEDMKRVENHLIKGKITLEQFFIALKAFDKAREKIFGYESKIYHPEKETIKILNENGYFNNTPNKTIHNYKREI